MYSQTNSLWWRDANKPASGKPGAVHKFHSTPSVSADRDRFEEGHELKQFRWNYSDPNRGQTGKGIAKYRCLKHTCQACPSKSHCCPNMDCRSITREEHEDARQVARDMAKTDQYVISM